MDVLSKTYLFKKVREADKMMNLYFNFAKAEMGFQIMLIAYLGACICYAFSILRSRYEATIYQIARFLFLLGWSLNAYILIERGIIAGRPPFKTFFESLIYFSFLFGLLALSIEWFKKIKLLGFLSLVIILSAELFALLKQDIDIVTVPPALNSGWFLPHVTIYFSGYSSVTVAFVLSILALIRTGTINLDKESFWARALGRQEVNFEELHRDWVRIGYLFLLGGLITGGLWAKFAWSDYWAWDPKENWGLISWLIYGVVLHMHHTSFLKGRAVLKVSAASWFLILFTYFGMSYLPTKSQSMHIYTEPLPPEEGKDVKGVNREMY